MTRPSHAKLFINDEPVGDVDMQGAEDSRSHGQFHADPAFEKFAPLFNRWSLMMRVDGPYAPLSDGASDELRNLEIEIDRLCAKLHFADSDTWVTCRQLNIDGPLIEWKSG